MLACGCGGVGLSGWVWGGGAGWVGVGGWGWVGVYLCKSAC